MNSVKEERRSNLFLDAYHVWTAKLLNCEYFLTTDRALIHQFTSNVTRAITPLDLLSLSAD